MPARLLAHLGGILFASAATALFLTVAGDGVTGSFAHPLRLLFGTFSLAVVLLVATAPALVPLLLFDADRRVQHSAWPGAGLLVFALAYGFGLALSALMVRAILGCSDRAIIEFVAPVLALQCLGATAGLAFAHRHVLRDGRTATHPAS